MTQSSELNAILNEVLSRGPPTQLRRGRSQPNFRSPGVTKTTLAPEESSSNSRNCGIQIVNEIWTTEKQYVKDLQVIVRVFLRPLLHKDIILKSDISVIFMNVESICDLHEQMLVQLEEVLLEKEIDNLRLGTVFLSLANFLKMYTTYCNGYNASLEKLTKYEKENTAFLQFIKTSEQIDGCGLHFRDYLIKPIQRLCKYPLLFRELLSVTPLDSPDYTHVLQACEKLNSITQSVNENAAEVLNFEKLGLFKKNVIGFDVDIATFWYVRDEILLDAISGKNRHVYLMAHAIIITKLPGGMIRGRKEKFLTLIDLSRAEVRDLITDNEFEVSSEAEGADKIAYRFVSSPGNKVAWVVDITEGINRVKEGYRLPRNMFRVVPVGPDQNVKNPLKIIRKKITRNTSNKHLKPTKEEILSTNDEFKENENLKDSKCNEDDPSSRAEDKDKDQFRHFKRRNSFLPSTKSLSMQSVPLSSSSPATQPSSNTQALYSPSVRTQTETPSSRSFRPISLPPQSNPESLNSAMSLSSLDNSQSLEIAHLRKQIKKLKAEKVEWQRKEQILTKKIESLEAKSRPRSIIQTENALPSRKNIEGKENHYQQLQTDSNETMLREYKQIQESMKILATRFDSFENLLYNSEHPF